MKENKDEKPQTKWEQQLQTKSASRTQRQTVCSNMSPEKTKKWNKQDNINHV